MYNRDCEANKGLRRTFVPYTIFIMLMMTCSAFAAADKPSPNEIVQLMLESQTNLRGYRSKAKVHVSVGNIKIPGISVNMSLKRPSDIDVDIIGISVKPKYPLLPDPMMLMGDQYELKTIPSERDEESFYIVDANPKKGTDSPYHLRLWVDKQSGLLKKAKLSLPNGDYSTISAQYIKMGNKCWVTSSISGQGSMIMKDILPIKPVELALKIAQDPQSVRFRADLTDIELL